MTASTTATAPAMSKEPGVLRRFMVWPALAALFGAATFITVQHVTGSAQDITQFIGAQIVRRGGYAASLSGVIGWGVHLSVSLSYAVLFAAIVLAPFFPSAGRVRWVAGLVTALLLGWVTTLLTAPAIALTISFLSGEGFPNSLPALNTALGVPFWNHVAFFGVSWLVTVVGRDLVNRRVG